MENTYFVVQCNPKNGTYDYAFFEIKCKNDSKMAIKYKIRLRDLKVEYLKEYILVQLLGQTQIYTYKQNRK